MSAAGRSPRTTQELVAIVADRSPPSMNRPKMAADVESRLSDLERKNAACYADMELLSLRLAQARDIVEASNCDGVPIGELEDVDSIVTSATDLKAITEGQDAD